MHALALRGSVALLLVACGDPTVDRPDGGFLANLVDARGMTQPPSPPSVDALPASMPYTVATIRGRANARRIILEGRGNPIAVTVLPDGSFCVDAPMPSPGPYVFALYAQGEDGQISAPATVVNVAFDPAASAIPGAQTCSGADPAGCAGAVEICGNNRDDDCNNLVDDRDPACARCTDDPLEPNDDPSAPRLDPRRYDNLAICPNDPDYYGVFVSRPSRVTVRIFFSHAMGDLDLHLLDRDRRTVLARSTSATDDEAVSITATATGEYKALVFGKMGASNRYALDLAVADP